MHNGELRMKEEAKKLSIINYQFSIMNYKLEENYENKI